MEKEQKNQIRKKIAIEWKEKNGLKYETVEQTERMDDKAEKEEKCDNNKEKQRGKGRGRNKNGLGIEKQAH